ncbi:uncharacterized protein ATNIH1004_007156 [Aspergillus tanneri]|uniref:Uncharacterized protein n=1 Tax=Aspergillus tanneri TaxID=1220188 RepID=A0A5M9MT84_9EURO|nr:uncharacterized protein ATNIH1004_007156 [Aspergillus tanneri]KAA8645737.1 hypothetical protein ATNIH1004_007156 [Aspergillus tanneri]
MAVWCGVLTTVATFTTSLAWLLPTAQLFRRGAVIGHGRQHGVLEGLRAIRVIQILGKELAILLSRKGSRTPLMETAVVQDGGDHGARSVRGVVQCE